MIYSAWDIKCDRLKLVIMGHFLPLYPHPLKSKKSEYWKNEKKMLGISSVYTCAPKTTIIWCMLPKTKSETDRMFCHFGPFFLPFYLTNNPVNQNFEEMKTLEDIIILHKCTKTENHMMYGSWDMEHNRQIFLSF